MQSSGRATEEPSTKDFSIGGEPDVNLFSKWV